LYSGRFGIHTGVVGHGGTAAQPKVEGIGRGFRDQFEMHGLAKQFQLKGMHTALISPFPARHGAHWFTAGFNEYHNSGKFGIEIVDDVQPTVVDWLSRNGARDNWYLHVNYWDAHTPYRTPASYGNPFENDPLPTWMDETLFERHRNRTGPHSMKDLGMYWGGNDPRYPYLPETIDSMKTLKRWIDYYDTGIRYVDDAIARVIGLLKKLGIYEDTAIVISADHGENQGELGIYGEHGTADEGTCHVPLIIRWPGRRRGAVDSGLHYQLDLAPTYMDLLEGTAPPLWDGVSFAGAINGTAASSREELVISQCAHVCQRSVRWDRWLYLRSYHDGFHLFPVEMLFDLRSDPHEQNDVASSNPDVCLQGAARLLRWQDAQMLKMSRTSSDVVDPLWTVMHEGGPFHALHDPTRSHLPEYLKRLEATGRADGAKQLRERYPHFG
jgi:arylsulfatase A-like enzyme